VDAVTPQGLQGLKDRTQWIRARSTDAAFVGFLLFCLWVACTRSAPGQTSGLNGVLQAPDSLLEWCAGHGVRVTHSVDAVAQAQNQLRNALHILEIGMVFTVIVEGLRRKWRLAVIAAGLLLLSSLAPPTPYLTFHGIELVDTVTNESSLREALIHPGAAAAEHAPASPPLRARDFLKDPLVIQVTREVNGPGRGDQMFATSLDINTVPAAQRGAAYYVLAQAGFTQGKASLVAERLAAMGTDYRASSEMEVERIGEMNAYAAAHGFPRIAFHDPRLRGDHPVAHIFATVFGVLSLLLIAGGMLCGSLAGRLEERVRRMNAKTKSAGSLTPLFHRSGVATLEQRIEILSQRRDRLKRLTPYLAVATGFLAAFTALFSLPPVTPVKAFHDVQVPGYDGPYLTSHGLQIIQGLAGDNAAYGIFHILFIWSMVAIGALTAFFIVTRRRWRSLVVGFSLTLMITVNMALDDRVTDITTPAPAVQTFIDHASPTPDEAIGLHYLAAELGYLGGDVARTSRELSQIRNPSPSSSSVATWRIWVMKEWCEAHGRPVSGAVGHVGKPLSIARIEAAALAALALLGVLSLGGMTLLAAAIGRRQNRIATLRSAPSTARDLALAA